MPNLIIESATKEHCQQLAPHMKAADVREVRLASGLSPLETLEASLVVSQRASTFFLEGQVVALSGVAALDMGTATCNTATCGIVWALTAPLTGWEKTFWKVSQKMISDYQKMFPLLTNFCDVENTETIRYLKKLGFVFLRRDDHFGVEEKPFYQFVRI